MRTRDRAPLTVTLYCTSTRRASSRCAGETGTREKKSQQRMREKCLCAAPAHVHSAHAAFCNWSTACSPHPARSADWPHGPCLRSQIGQNGQILFISGEQLSLNVADDSAKTLSVLGNMGGVLDDCGLRFVQKCRRPPKKKTDFGGPISKKKKHGHAALPKSYQIDELTSQTSQSHVPYTYLPSALEIPN